MKFWWETFSNFVDWKLKTVREYLKSLVKLYNVTTNKTRTNKWVWKICSAHVGVF